MAGHKKTALPDTYLDRLLSVYSHESQVVVEIDDLLLDHPSARLSTAKDHLLHAIQREIDFVENSVRREQERNEWRDRHEADLEARRQERINERAAVRAENAEAKKYDQHTIDMAASFKPPKTPQEFLDWQAEQRKEMAGKPRISWPEPKKYEKPDV